MSGGFWLPLELLRVPVLPPLACWLTPARGQATAGLAPSDVVGVAEIAVQLRVKPQTVAMWRYRGLLPEPRWIVSGVPVWRWADVARWAAETGRLRRGAA